MGNEKKTGGIPRFGIAFDHDDPLKTRSAEDSDWGGESESRLKQNDQVVEHEGDARTVIARHRLIYDLLKRHVDYGKKLYPTEFFPREHDVNKRMGRTPDFIKKAAICYPADFHKGIRDGLNGLDDLRMVAGHEDILFRLDALSGEHQEYVNAVYGLPYFFMQQHAGFFDRDSPLDQFDVATGVTISMMNARLDQLAREIAKSE